MVMVVDIVMVEADIMGVFIVAGGEVNFLAILDVILKVLVIDHVVVWFSGVTLRLGSIRGLLRECGGDHARGNKGRVVQLL
jgi:hypothetical protein